MRQYIAFAFVVLAALLWSPELAAQLPRTVSFQGVLVDAANKPLPDGQHQISIAMYASMNGGTALYSETHSATLKDGLFSVIIGSVTSIPAAIEFDKQYYLGISVDNGPEMAPRTAFTAVPYALHAARATTAKVADALAPGAGGVVGSINGLDGDIVIQGAGGTTVTKSGNTIVITSTGGSSNGIAGVQNNDGTLDVANPTGPVATLGVADNSIGTNKLKNDAVTSDKIFTEAVTTAKIADAAVITAKILDGAITTVKLNDGAVTTPKLIDQAVTNPKLADESVGTTKLKDNAVTNLKLADESVGTSKLKDNAVTSAKIADGAVQSGDLADDAVTSSKIASGAVTLDKLSTTGAQNGQVPVFNSGTVTWADAASGSGSGFSLPYSDTIDIWKPAIYVDNLGGDGLTAKAKDGRNGIRGIVSDGGGSSFYLNAGVAGFSSTGRGVGGTSRDGIGIEGSSENSNAGKFTVLSSNNPSAALSASTQGTGNAIYGRYNPTTGTAAAIEGVTQSVDAFAAGVIGRASATNSGANFGVYGLNHSTSEYGAGVIGTHAGGGSGVEGTSSGGVGVYGHSHSYQGVKGYSENNAGVLGGSNSGYGIEGYSNTNIGIYGSGVASAGVKGSSFQGAGVEGSSGTGPGVRGNGNGSAPGVIGYNSTSQSAVRAENAGSGSGLFASSGSGAAVWAFATSGIGVRAYSGSENIIEAHGAGGMFGNLRFRVLQDGNVRCDGAFTGGGADVAEAFDFEGSRNHYEAGDVLIVSEFSDRKVAKSASAYSTAVAGVFATKPGVLLAPYNAEDDLGQYIPLGMMGVIPTKVTTENGIIRRGDLLVTSSTPGHAMKASPVVVNGIKLYPSGTIIGKALQNFDGTRSGLIEVLVNVK